MKEIKENIAAEEEYDKTLFNDKLDEFYSTLKKDLNTCFKV